MIRIKAVDAQNILDVCALKTIQDDTSIKIEGHLYCNAVFIAKAKYHPEMHPNAIYNNHALIGFFMYKRTENQTDTTFICRLMIDNKFQQRGLEEKAFEHILKGLKIQGVKKIVLVINNAFTKKLLHNGSDQFIKGFYDMQAIGADTYTQMYVKKNPYNSNPF